MDTPLLFYVPVPDQNVGENIAQKLLDKKLIACANIYPPHTALYHWDGKVQKEQESLMILKSQNKHKDLIEKELLKIHPYETPCILHFTADGCNTDFMDWINTSTLQKGETNQ